MRDGTEIRREREVTMKIERRVRETGKKEIINLTVGLHDTGEILGCSESNFVLSKKVDLPCP